MNLRSIALLGFLGLTTSCSGKNIKNYLVPILPAETIYDSPIVSTPDEDSLDSKKAEKVKAIAKSVIEQKRPLGVIQTKRDTATVEYFLPATGVSRDGRPFRLRKVVGESPITHASTCLVLNGKRYEIYAKNVNEEFATRFFDKDQLVITILGDKPCGERYFSMMDDGLDGRVNNVDLLPEALPKMLGYQMIQTNYNATQKDTIKVNPSEEMVRRIQNIYEETIDELFRFYKGENENIQRSVLRNSKTSPER